MDIKIIRKTNAKFDESFNIMALENGELYLHTPRRSLNITAVANEFADFVLRVKEGVAPTLEYANDLAVSFYFREEYTIQHSRGGCCFSFGLSCEDAEFLASYILQRNAANAAAAQEAAQTAAVLSQAV